MLKISVNQRPNGNMEAIKERMLCDVNILEFTVG